MRIEDFDPYKYRATVVPTKKCKPVVDGDTIEMIWDFGGPHEIKERWRCRLLGYNTAEVVGAHKAEGLKAAAALAAILPIGTRIHIRTQLDELSLERILAHVYIEGSDGELVDVADLMQPFHVETRYAAAKGRR